MKSNLRQIIILLVCFIVLVGSLFNGQEMALAQKSKSRSKTKHNSNSKAKYQTYLAYQNGQNNQNQLMISHSKQAISNKIDAIARYYGLDPVLVQMIVKQESGFNPNARSSANAMGLMQMIPSTARRFGVNNPYDPDESLHGGCRYFVWLLRRYNGRLDLALAGYNAGEGAVERHGYKIPPYKETQGYVRSITNGYLVKLGVNKSNQQIRYKTVRTKVRQPVQYSNSVVSANITKQKLDVIDGYFSKDGSSKFVR
ncbi:MAG: lytic transglycosylase domain-containing protein [Blastocatellia bacterium]